MAKTGKPIMGRPSSFTQEVADTLCERIACGESLKSICREESQPEERTVFRWLRASEDFRQQYARAREEMADADADAVGDIGHRVMAGEIEPQAARVAMDAFKWSAGKRNAKKYGDKIQHSSDPDNPMPAPIVTVTLVRPE